MSIKDYSVGDVFIGFVLVKEVRKGTAKNGNDYLSVILSDRESEIQTMVWDVDDEKEFIFTTSKVIKVKGTIGEYQNKKQINLQRYRIANESDNVSLSDVTQTSPVDPKQITDSIRICINNMENTTIKKVTDSIFTKYESEFEKFPAAKGMHHAYNGGLAFHTFSMLNLAKEITTLYPIFNKDLLFAGVILHDIMKVVEYNFDGVTTKDYTLEGKLVGHISLMSEQITRTAEELGVESKEEVLLLKHCIIAHHEKGEWGSPVAPQIPEAQALHMIDMFDAKFEMLRKGLEGAEIGQFTERLFGLDNRAYYKHGL